MSVEDLKVKTNTLHALRKQYQALFLEDDPAKYPEAARIKAARDSAEAEQTRLLHSLLVEAGCTPEQALGFEGRVRMEHQSLKRVLGPEPHMVLQKPQSSPPTILFYRGETERGNMIVIQVNHPVMTIGVHSALGYPC